MGKKGSVIHRELFSCCNRRKIVEYEISRRPQEIISDKQGYGQGGFLMACSFEDQTLKKIMIKIQML